MEEQLVTFETAKLAKEKGFNISCDARWWIEPASDWKLSKQGVIKCDNSGDSISAPTQPLLQKWLREVHRVEIAVQWFDNCYIKAVAKKPFKANTYRVEGFQSYEEALETGLQEALKLV